MCYYEVIQVKFLPSARFCPVCSGTERALQIHGGIIIITELFFEIAKANLKSDVSGNDGS